MSIADDLKKKMKDADSRRYGNLGNRKPAPRELVRKCALVFGPNLDISLAV